MELNLEWTLVALVLVTLVFGTVFFLEWLKIQKIVKKAEQNPELIEKLVYPEDTHDMLGLRIKGEEEIKVMGMAGERGQKKFKQLWFARKQWERDHGFKSSMPNG